MANSTSSKASRTTDKTGSGQKGAKRGRVQQVVHGVKKGRVKKHRRGGAVAKRVREVSEQEEEEEESNSEIPAGETNDTDEDDPYDHVGTDGDCSEESGSATEKDTPTRIALERRQESRREIRSKITSRPLPRPKDLVRPSSQLTPTTPSTTKQNQRQFIRGNTLPPVA